MGLDQKFAFMEYSNRKLRKQLVSVLDTTNRISDKMARLRGRLEFYLDRGTGMTPEEVKEVYVELDNMLRGRTRDTI